MNAAAVTLFTERFFEKNTKAGLAIFTY